LDLHDEKKSKVFGIFKTFKGLVENQTSSNIKYLKFDNGEEYCSKQFDQYSIENGIQKIEIVPLTPRENGVVERMNKTIFETTRNMFSNAGL